MASASASQSASSASANDQPMIEIVRNNIVDMLDARGEDASYIGEHGDAVPNNRYLNEIITLDTDKTTVFYAINKDLLNEWKGMDAHKTHESLLSTYKKRKNFILVLSETPSSMIMNKLVAIDKALGSTVGGMLQVFYIRELLYNPLKHDLTPPHEKLSEEEAKQVMASYLITKKLQLPIILRSDVVSRWLGLRQGDIVKITRYNPTSGTYYYYRCCV